MYIYLVEVLSTKGDWVSSGVAYQSKQRANVVAGMKGKDERGNKLGRVSQTSLIWEERDATD